MQKFLTNFFISSQIILSGSFICVPRSSGSEKNPFTTKAETRTVTPESEVPLPGAWQISSFYHLLKGKRVGLVVNQTSKIKNAHLVDTLLQSGIQIETIFAPEHGFRGDHSDGALIKNEIDSKTGIKITSIYGSNKKPTPQQMADLDILVFDIQDVGVRFYTYISSMHYIMEACVENGKKLIILDRPNPNGNYIDGPVLEKEFKSFIGMHPIPIVHGLTVGELAKMINGEKWLEGKKTCNLTVIPVKNYTHKTPYVLPVRPSPNLPTKESVYLYPSVGFFEGTNVSVGRGTEFPFELIGRPGQKEGSKLFTPKSIPGVSDNPPYKGIECRGFFLRDFCNHYILGLKRIYLDWLILFYQTNDESINGPFFNKNFNLLAGNATLQEQIKNKTDTAEIYKSWEKGLENYKKTRKKYLLYPD